VTYTLSWGAGSAQTGGTSHTITGLANFRTYTVSVTAHNAAGDSPSSGSRQVSIVPAGTWGGTIYNNAVYPVNVRSAPNTGASIVHQYPPGGGQSVSVICVTGGGSWQDPTGNPSGSTWFKVTYPGYIATGYVSTGGAGVWDC
jgi:Bacterial SH3 domain